MEVGRAVGMLDPGFGIKCCSGTSFAMTAMESVLLWIALTPKEFDDLTAGKEVIPDE